MVLVVVTLIRFFKSLTGLRRISEMLNLNPNLLPGQVAGIQYDHLFNSSQDRGGSQVGSETGDDKRRRLEQEACDLQTLVDQLADQKSSLARDMAISREALTHLASNITTEITDIIPPPGLTIQSIEALVNRTTASAKLPPKTVTALTSSADKLYGSMRNILKIFFVP